MRLAPRRVQKIRTLATEAYQMLVAAALTVNAQETVLKLTTRQIVFGLARSVPWQSARRLIQLRLKYRPVLLHQRMWKTQ